jgi:glutathione peroxidase-family protein
MSVLLSWKIVKSSLIILLINVAILCDIAAFFETFRKIYRKISRKGVPFFPEPVYGIGEVDATKEGR